MHSAQQPLPPKIRPTPAELHAARAACDRFVQGGPQITMQHVLQTLAASAGSDDVDVYGDGGDVLALEAEVAELLGKPAAVFMPSGTMAQQCVLRVWADRSGHKAVALHALSHLVMNEQRALEELHGIRMRELTRDARPLVADDLATHPGPLGALCVELPLRNAGYLLPTWDELTALTAAARERGIPVHLDGARLWESQPYYDRSHAEIAELADTIYVSFYKGLGIVPLSGAVLAGPADVIAEARQWRHRHGGTLFTSAPFARLAREGLRTRLDGFAAQFRQAKAIAVALSAVDGLRVPAQPPRANGFLLHLEASSDAVLQAMVDVAQAERIWTLHRPWDAEVPGWTVTEFVADTATVEWTPQEVAEVLGRVAQRAREFDRQPLQLTAGSGG